MRMTRRLRHLLDKPGMLVAPGCFDAISALIVKEAGFEALYVTGSGLVTAMLGYPDMGLTTLTEVTDQAGRIADATGLPVICDAEAGFGSYVNVVRAVREFEKAGVAAIHMEDQVTPPNNPGIKRRDLLPRDRAVGMIKAALDARTDPDLVIIARSDGDEVSIDELIERCNLYLEAGADLAMPLITRIHGQRSTGLPAEIVVEAHRRVCSEVEGPTLGCVLPDVLTVEEIEEFGYKVYIYPTDSLQAAMAAMYEMNTELKTAGTTKDYFDLHHRIAPDVLRRMVRTDEWVELDKRYVP
jgi:methylisocitrate lyase